MGDNRTHLYQRDDGTMEEHLGLRVHCSICMCDPRYNRDMRR